MRTCLVLVVALCAGAHLRAQSGGTAQVAGTVQDSRGGAIPGAGIRVTQTDTAGIAGGENLYTFRLQ